MDIEDWLHSLDLGQYALAFRNNEVDDQILSSLTAEDLKEIGVGPVGHRRKLLDAIAALPTGKPSPSVQPSAPTASPDPHTGAERRQLTVMFCDISGSTALSTRLDPEDLSAVIRSYQSVVRTTIAHFGGFIARYVGDGVLIYFGWPEAHETDAETAVRAGLEVIAAVTQGPIHGEKLSIRLGIATGLVVIGAPIGEGDARQQTAIGETPNLAARIQSLAAPNTLVIADSTRAQVGSLFDLEDLGERSLAGFAGPQRAWRVDGDSKAAASRYEALRSETGPLIGRDEELQLILRRWERAKESDGQIVLISGEAGIGKSRMTAALRGRLAAEQPVQLRYFCSPYHQDSALHPFVAAMERAAGFTREDSPAAKLAKLAAELSRAADSPPETVAAFADLLGLATKGHYPPPPSDPRRRRELILGALLGQLEKLAERRPVLFVLEDAHWADSTSLELLERVAERARQLPVLLVLTHRPNFASPWTGDTQVTSLTLNRLGRRESATLIERVAGGKALPNEIVDRIVRQTDGIPLFIEELTKTLLEGGQLKEEDGRYLLVDAMPTLAIPLSLRDSLMARLDRLGPVKEVAQIGATIGREFSSAVLEAIFPPPAGATARRA